MWTVAFVTAENLLEINAKTGVDQVCIFIPTTPNPTAGFIYLVPAAEVIELDVSVDAAMKMIVTLGVVVPPSMRPSLQPVGQH
jgi:uncharacterized membrane protein